MTDNVEPFERPVRADALPADGETLIVDLEGYEGPLDVLLTLARDQKVDLAKISILQLAEQYLVFVERARRFRLEIAADYLVMAAWLAYLKSKLLLPEPEEEGPSGEELAARLSFRLQRLEAMRAVAEKLFDRQRFGLDVMPRGRPEGIKVLRRSTYECTLYELLKAYAEHKESEGISEPLRLMRTTIYSVDEALGRLKRLLGNIPSWSTLQAFLPENIQDSFEWRSAMASTLVATLQMAKEGDLEVQQNTLFGPIMIKKNDK